MAKKIFKVKRVYDMANTFEELHIQGQNGEIFNDLYSLIVGESNILLAMKNVKSSIGRLTKGADGKTISAYENFSEEKLIQLVKHRLHNFKPMKVRRVFIPKSNGTKRTLGILTFEDRLIQQCIRQVLEPICESKFHANSFGFRSLRSTKHAVLKMILLMQMTKYDYCVDVDIENFFDNIDHKILINQIHSLGIHDKKLLAIISKMLKVNVEGEGVKKLGLIQGGVLSPLLSNIVLNELDWWINAQCKMSGQTSAEDRIYFVRYADDFRILCKTFSDAFKVFNVVKAWLKEKLNLNISGEKSKIVNLRTQGTEFLGFKIKATLNDSAYSVESHVSDDNKLKIQNALCKIIAKIDDEGKNARRVLQDLNRQIATSHSYYQSASHVQQDFLSISRNCQSLLDDKLKNIALRVPFFPDAPNVMTYKVDDVILIPIECISYKRVKILPPSANIYVGTGSQKPNVAKFSRRPIKKSLPHKKKRTTEKTAHSESSSSLAKIKNSVVDFLYRLSAALPF